MGEAVTLKKHNWEGELWQRKSAVNELTGNENVSGIMGDELLK